MVNIYNEAGQSVLPDNTSTNIVSGFPRNVNHAVDLNSFYGYAPAINRTTGVRGPFVTDPSCLYDAATQRFFVVVLTLETPGRAFTRQSSRHRGQPDEQSYQPLEHLSGRCHGRWLTGPLGGPCPCLGDYPHRRGCLRLLHHDQLVPVGAGQLRRCPDLRVLERSLPQVRA